MLMPGPAAKHKGAKPAYPYSLVSEAPTYPRKEAIHV